MGLIRFISKAFKRDKNHLVIRKSDDELTRYLKQKNIMAERQRYQNALEKEEEKRRAGLNANEKKILYFEQQASISTKVYPKTELSDAYVDLDFMSDKQNYNPLGQNKSIFNPKRWYVPIPHENSSHSGDIPFYHWPLRIIGGLILAKIGYSYGMEESYENTSIIKGSKMIEFESEDQIFDMLLNKDNQKTPKEAIFLYLYTPGLHNDMQFYNLLEKESQNEEYKDVQFMVAHCRKHLQFCSHKTFAGRIFPQAELYYINEEDEIELMDMDTWHRSSRGIRGFMQHSGVTEKPKVFEIF